MRMQQNAASKADREAPRPSERDQALGQRPAIIKSLASNIDGDHRTGPTFSVLCNIRGLCRFLRTEQIEHLDNNCHFYLAIFAPLMYVVAFTYTFLRITLATLHSAPTALYAAFLNTEDRAKLLKNNRSIPEGRTGLVLHAIFVIPLILPFFLIYMFVFSFYHFTCVWLRSLRKSLTAIAKHIGRNGLAYTGLTVLALGGVALYGTLLQASWMPAAILSLSGPLALVPAAAILTLSAVLLAIKIIMSCQSRESNKSSRYFVDTAVARKSSLLAKTPGAAPSAATIRRPYYAACSGSAHPGATAPGAHYSYGSAPARDSSASR